ncbi:MULTISPECIES: hypothetical protein [unclassified Streptomyces]|uniref:hypothetical protein n=1 Tax=Streptomyces TaxID=1883 RepID=UPI000823889C|nr:MULTISPECIES: hypothetical protein [unclassified Streptomyces]AWN26513.1 hypothetical protein DKG71_10620 [Streptomyces sp. NEAU-S7GS2]MYT18496.1 hypothetical protein [Streptomyces sp. SID4951]SCK57112.1 hypothetical protein YWIDRAFT_08224 [Streptomyces sp. SceaMP-e96]
MPIARSLAKPWRCRATVRPLIFLASLIEAIARIGLANIDMGIRSRSRAAAVPAAPPAAVARPVADGRPPAPVAMSGGIDAPAIAPAQATAPAPATATAPRMATADLADARR